jgi:hypothetical protein
MATVIAERGGGRYLLIGLDDSTGQVLDTQDNLLYPAQSIAALASRGYWTDPAQPYDADALVRNASALQPSGPPATVSQPPPAPAP